MAVKKGSEYFPLLHERDGGHNLHPPGRFFSETPAHVFTDTFGVVLTYQQPCIAMENRWHGDLVFLCPSLYTCVLRHQECPTSTVVRALQVFPLHLETALQNEGF